MTEIISQNNKVGAKQVFFKVPPSIARVRVMPPFPPHFNVGRVVFWILRNYFHESDRAAVHGKRAVNIEMWGRGAGHRNSSEMRPPIILRKYFRHQYPHRPGRGQNVRIRKELLMGPNRAPDQFESKSCEFGWPRQFRFRWRAAVRRISPTAIAGESLSFIAAARATRIRGTYRKKQKSLNPGHAKPNTKLRSNTGSKGLRMGGARSG